MNILLARHHGMCFGVRDALRITHAAALRAPVTTLGQLVHNPLADFHLTAAGVLRGEINDLASASTNQVIITAHGASDRHRQSWREAGHHLVDTTCPLVRKAHSALALLVNEGWQPVVIGQRHHVEVAGLTGDFPNAVVVLEEADVEHVPEHPQLGVISQTTQPLELVLSLVEAIKRRHPRSAVRFIDTVCQPTKLRQLALEDLLQRCDHIVVIGGRNSNNTRQLARKATAHGRRTLQVERAEELDPGWFLEARTVGVTAGTSTLDETVATVMDRLRQIAAELLQPAA